MTFLQDLNFSVNRWFASLLFVVPFSFCYQFYLPLFTFTMSIFYFTIISASCALTRLTAQRTTSTNELHLSIHCTKNNWHHKRATQCQHSADTQCSRTSYDLRTFELKNSTPATPAMGNVHANLWLSVFQLRTRTKHADMPHAANQDSRKINLRVFTKETGVQ